MGNRNKKNKNIQMPAYLVYLNFLPLFFYVLAAAFAMIMIKNAFFVFGVAVCALSSGLKNINKYLDVKKDISVTWFEKQMLIAIPVGILFMIIGIWYANYMTDLIPFNKGLTTTFATIFFAISVSLFVVLLMVMYVRRRKDIKTTLLKLSINTLVFLFLFLAMLFTYLNYPFR